MSKRMLPYHEGDWCSIPLGKGGYALALIARSNGKGHLFCYFFGPRVAKAPQLESTHALRPENALFHALCLDTGLIRKHWRFIGRPTSFERFDWPIPPLLERSPNGQVQAVQFADTLSSLSRKPLPHFSEEALHSLQGSSLLSASTVEGLLDKTLPMISARIFPVV